MPTVDVTAVWASVTLTADEIWQAREATILTTIEAPVRADQGVELVPGAVRTFKAGQTVRFRAKSTTAPLPILAREAL